MALLYALHKLNIDGLVVHVNYGLRGEESNGDQELVEQVSAMWGFEGCSIRPGKAPGGRNFQQWARDTRYEFFEDLKKEYNADAIAVAHHQDDQLETVLFRILRGSGLDKLSAMNEWDDSRSIWRPFLKIPKQDLIDFAKKSTSRIEQMHRMKQVITPEMQFEMMYFRFLSVLWKAGKEIYLLSRRWP